MERKKRMERKKWNSFRQSLPFYYALLFHTIALSHQLDTLQLKMNRWTKFAHNAFSLIFCARFPPKFVVATAIQRTVWSYIDAAAVRVRLCKRFPTVGKSSTLSVPLIRCVLWVGWCVSTTANRSMHTQSIRLQSIYMKSSHTVQFHSLIQLIFPFNFCSLRYCIHPIAHPAFITLQHVFGSLQSTRHHIHVCRVLASDGFSFAFRMFHAIELCTFVGAFAFTAPDAAAVVVAAAVFVVVAAGCYCCLIRQHSRPYTQRYNRLTDLKSEITHAPQFSLIQHIIRLKHLLWVQLSIRPQGRRTCFLHLCV